jgi:hypothetical protein
MGLCVRQLFGESTMSSANESRIRSSGESDATKAAWLRTNAALELPSILGTALHDAMLSEATEMIAHVQSDFMCRLTLELSGGVAVRLERTVRLTFWK